MPFPLPDTFLALVTRASRVLGNSTFSLLILLFFFFFLVSHFEARIAIISFGESVKSFGRFLTRRAELSLARNILGKKGSRSHEYLEIEVFLFFLELSFRSPSCGDFVRF